MFVSWRYVLFLFFLLLNQVIIFVKEKLKKIDLVLVQLYL